MNINHLEAVVVWKLCPSCALGMVRETGNKIYQCNHAKCRAVFDYSHLSDAMIDSLLQRKKPASPESKE